MVELFAPLERCALRVGDAEVELWSSLAGAPGTVHDDAWALLRPEERAQLDRMRVPARRAAAVASRALLRLVLASYTGLPAGEIILAQGERGKPHLPQGAEIPIEFNVSHSGELLVVAVCRTRPVGVDVERRRPLSHASQMAARALPRPDHLRFEALVEQGAAPEEAFLRVWTSVEARAKAIGRGIETTGARIVEVGGVPWQPLDHELAAMRLDGFVGAVALGPAE